MYQDETHALCTVKARWDRHALRGILMVRVKMAVMAGVLAGGLAIPSTASADTAQIVYAWGFNDQG